MPIRSAHILAATLRLGDATSQHTFELARALRRQGIDVRIFHDHPAGPLPADIAPLARQVRPGDYEPSADLTIVQYAIWFPLGERLRDAPGAAVFWYHGVTPPALWGTTTGLDTLQMSEIRASLVWHAHLAVAASPFTAQELHRHTGYPLERIQVMPLAVEIEALAAAPGEAQLAALRTRWRLTGKRVLLFVGRIAGNKRIDLLIQALARLHPTYPDLHLLIIGDTAQSEAARELTARLQALARDLGVAEHVTWTGRVDDITPYLHLAEISLLASQHEGFGVPVVEALAAGTPVVASAGGALPWVLGAGADGSRPEEAAGLLFPPGDVEALARQVARLLDDPALRAGLAARGRQHARRYDTTVFAGNVADLLQRVTTLSAEAPPAAGDLRHPLFAYADVALRGYAVRSGAPLVGRWIEWVRRHSTSHVKEAYLDPIIERQVTYNQLLAAEVERLQAEVRRLQAQIARRRDDKPPT